MKKRFINIVVIIALCLSMLILPSCSSAQAKPSTLKQADIITPEQMDKNLKEFLLVSDAYADGNGGSRAYTSDSATASAKFLHDKYSATVTGGDKKEEQVYKNLKVTPLIDTSFDLEFMTGNVKESRTAYNVEIKYESKTKQNSEQVIIGACYDNSVGSPKQDNVGTTSLGALENGVSVALLMSLIDYINETNKDFGFDIVFCFFAGAYGSAGSIDYIDRNMKPEQKEHTLLMVNLYRLGAQRTYIYSDEVPTMANKFLYDEGEKAGLELYKIPKTISIIEKQYISKVPYLHWGMIGDHAPFMEKNMPVANIFGGYYGGLALNDVEKKGSVNLGNTKEDTYTNLVKYRSEYAQNMSDVATLLINSFSNPEFSQVARASKNNVFDYSFWANPLWAELIVIGIIILLILLVILLVKHFEKKYPFKPLVRKLKIAVFGLEYETQTPEDVYVDIKKKRDPFSGY